MKSGKRRRIGDGSRDAPAAGHAPARIPNHRRLRAGALAQRLQHVCIILRYICIATKGRGASARALAPAAGHAPARTPNHRQLLAGALARVSNMYVSFFMVYMYRY